MEITPLLLVVAMAATLAVIIWLLERSHARGFAEGVASAQIEPATRLVSAAVAKQILALEFAAAERGRPLTIVLFHIDNYRRIAPLQGGAVGGKVLLTVGAILRRRTRGMNISARFDDAGLFISILGGVHERGASVFVSRVLKDLSTIETGTQPLSLSYSVCEYVPAMDSPDEMLEAARAALAHAVELEAASAV